MAAARRNARATRWPLRRGSGRLQDLQRAWAAAGLCSSASHAAALARRGQTPPVLPRLADARGTGPMSVFGVLLREHRQIRLVIDAIHALLEQTGPHARLATAPFVALEDFSLRFADGAHHQREEQVLFAELARAGLPPGSGPLAEKHHEHEQARKYAAVAGAAARAVDAGDVPAAVELRAAARAWCVLSERHLLDEERFLFPLAHRLIPAHRLAQLGAELAAADPALARDFAASAAAVVAAAVSAAAHGRRSG